MELRQNSSETGSARGRVLPDMQTALGQASDQAWIDVIQHMESMYTDLVQSQVELEEKNVALENAHRFIASVISSMTDILIVCDVKGKILQVNQALERAYFGTETVTTKIEGESLSALFQNNSLPPIELFPEKIESGQLIDFEVDLLNSNGDSIPLSINCNARLNYKNRLSGFVITGRPLGELRKAYSNLHLAHEDLKNAQQQIVRSEKMASLGRLVAGVAHELNNPISFIYANMHALQDYEQRISTYLDSVRTQALNKNTLALREELQIDFIVEDMESLVTGSLEGAERVTEIVQNLRRFANPQPPGRQKIDLVEMINRACSWVFKASSTQPLIVNELPTELIVVNSEPHIHQILVNLIQNAAYALLDSSDPKIVFSSHCHEDGTQLTVRDNGPGIEKQNLVKVFDPFFTTKAIGNGTGLGLYISFRLATEQCGGDLTVRNHGDGGAEFTLSLPILRECDE